MNTIITILVAILTSLGLGGFASWFYFIKYKKNKAEDKAKETVKDSKKQDKSREEIKKDIDEQIKKNKEIRDKIDKLL